MNNKKLISYLRSICSSDQTLRVASLLSEDNSIELLNILDYFDLGDCIIFYMCKNPNSINRIKYDLKTNGEISPSFEDLIFRSSASLGYI